MIDVLKFFLFINAFLLLGLSGAECQQLVFTPKWTAQAQFAGYYVSSKMGFYQEEGLDVKIQHPTVAESSFSFLEAGRAQIVVMNLSQALTARIAGTRVVNIMQTSQTNSLMLVGHSPLVGAASLQNQKIAVWNHLSQGLLDMLARKYGLHIEWIRFNSGVDLFLSGAVDICLVGSYNELPQLAEFGMKVDSAHILKLADFGYNLPEDGLYVTEEFYRKYPDIVQKFVRASVKGWKWVAENQEKAIDIVMEEVRQNNIGTNRYHQRMMLEEVLRLQYEKGASERTYRLSPQGFARAMDNLCEDKMRNGISYQDFVK